MNEETEAQGAQVTQLVKNGAQTIARFPTTLTRVSQKGASPQSSPSQQCSEQGA